MRRSLSIIPQTPVVFIGTIKYNLDPLQQYKDEAIWNILKEVDLFDYVSSLDDKLETLITYNSSVFSVGQKQLMCLARTMLKKSKIVILDEATANVDFKTDQFIQEQLKVKFKESTVFTIAHRLSTIMDYDKIIVMDAGMVAEFGSPIALLTNDPEVDQEITKVDGIFAQMVLQTGEESARALFSFAQKAYQASKTPA